MSLWLAYPSGYPLRCSERIRLGRAPLRPIKATSNFVELRITQLFGRRPSSTSKRLHSVFLLARSTTSLTDSGDSRNAPVSLQALFLAGITGFRGLHPLEVPE